MSTAINARLAGKQVQHPNLGLCVVAAPVPGTRTLVEIRCIQRGPGWDEFSESYKPYTADRPNPEAGPGAMTIIRRLTRRDQYGHKDVAHVKELTLKS